MMWTHFLQTLGGKLADRWVAVLLTPAFFFWGVGLATLIGHDDQSLLGWGLSSLIPGHSGWLHVSLPQKPTTLPTEIQVAWIVGGLLLVGISAVIAQRLMLPVIQFAEGYWPSWSGLIRRWMERRQASAVRQATRRREEL